MNAKILDCVFTRPNFSRFQGNPILETFSSDTSSRLHSSNEISIESLQIAQGIRINMNLEKNLDTLDPKN